MSSAPQAQPPSADVIEQGYEPLEASAAGLLIFLILFVITGAILLLGVWFLLKHHAGVTRKVDVPVSAVAPAQRFVAPSLQPSPEHNSLPREDLARLREMDERRLKEMGWTRDATSGEWVVPDAVMAELSRRYPASQANARKEAAR